MNPPESYLNWSFLPFPRKEFKSRRAKLMALLAAAGGGVFLTPSRHHFSDGFTFRQLDDFLYFTGLEVPDSVLAIDADRGETTLFVPENDPRFENPTRPNDFPGRPLRADRPLAEAAGLYACRSIDEHGGFLAEWQRSQRPVWINPGRGQSLTPLQSQPIHSWNPLDGFRFFLQSQYPNLNLHSTFESIARLRMIKSAAEQAVMRRACAITMESIRATAPLIRPGVDERTLEGILEAEFKKRGAQRLPFASIIKSGPNSLWPWRILAAHYDRRNRVMQDEELVVFDVGCEVDYYGSDMGRTFPVSGRFTPRQRDILAMQLEVLDGLIEAMRPGVTLAQAHTVTEKLIPRKAKPYMQVGLFFGHHIGLSPGDPSLADVPLAPGMIITVEPWYYNHAEPLATFNEDVILITEDGRENLTATLPRTAEGMAGMVAG